MINWEEKMNNNFYEIPNDWYSEFNNTFMNSIDNGMNMPNNIFSMNNMNNNLADPKVALDRGNLFNNLYDPYRNYKYRELKASNNREDLLLNILKHNFVLVELGLYLDLNPRDKSMVNLYNNYLNAKKKLVDQYERSYGPLTMDGLNMGDNDWNWFNSPWPWEGTK